MSQSNPDIQSILAALGMLPLASSAAATADRIQAAQRPASSTPGQTAPGVAPSQSYPLPPASAGPSPYQAPPPGSSYAPGNSALPAPASSGNVDLSSIRPVNSGSMNFNDIISKARAFAAEKGVASYDRPLVYNSDSRNPDRLDNTRSHTPPRNDHYNERDSSYHDDRRGGRDRGHGRDRDRSYSPGSRNRTFSPRNGRDRSPLRGGDDNSETIQIESSLVGLIIGRQGENLRRIESESGCRVQFLGSNDGGPFRQCKISGPRPRRAEVKDDINRIIEDSGMGPLNRAQEKPREQNRGGHGAVQLRDGEDHMQIMVPDRTVGLIIGRGGETIRDLQERSGCHVNIVGESKSVNGLRPVNLIGSREAAARAKDAIMEIVDSDSRGEAPAQPKRQPQGGYGDDRPQRDGGASDKVNDSIMVPSEAVGMIIGKGGETIREMQNQTGCKINVAQSSGPGEVQREISLIGSQDAISRAKAAIDEKVDAVRQKSGGGGGGGSGRGYRDYDRPKEHSSAPSNQQPAPASGDASDPYAQYGGYQNYLALWYQSMMYQQQQGGQGAAPGAPAPGS